MTAVPKRVLRALDARDGHACSWHWAGACDTDTLVPHHRMNRGHGGSRNGDVLSNLVWLCSGMNGLIESDAELARRARRRGIKVPRNGWFDAADVPILHAVHGWCVLTVDGRAEPVSEGFAHESLEAYGLRPWEEGVPA